MVSLSRSVERAPNSNILLTKDKGAPLPLSLNDTTPFTNKLSTSSCGRSGLSSCMSNTPPLSVKNASEPISKGVGSIVESLVCVEFQFNSENNVTSSVISYLIPAAAYLRSTGTTSCRKLARLKRVPPSSNDDWAKLKSEPSPLNEGPPGIEILP